jgi:uncharacterized protein (DUF1810 family)
MDNLAGRYDLERFVTAQAPVIEQVLQELRNGRKRSHWMWFVFPQLAGLGSSATARHYAISGKAEAAAYLAHPVLGPRLLECTRLVNMVQGRSAFDIFSSPDDLKFRSSMTLFYAAAPEVPEYGEALAKYFGNQGDPLTIEKLSVR